MRGNSKYNITKVGRVQPLDYRAEVVRFVPQGHTNTQSLKMTEK